MTVDEAVARVRSALGDQWPRCKRIPAELVAEVCDSLWEIGVTPSSPKLAYYLPYAKTAFSSGVMAWLKLKGLNARGAQWGSPLVISLEELKRRISPEVASAPLTCCDPSNNSNWAVPGGKALSYVARIENPSLRDVMALFILIRANEQQYRSYERVYSFVGVIRLVMKEQSIENVTAIDPNHLLVQVYHGEMGRGLTEYQRSTLIRYWNAVRNALEDYASRLSPCQFQSMSRFFIQPITDRRKLARLSPVASWVRKREARVKLKSDTVHACFHKLRYVARIRFNQAARLYEAVQAAIVHAQRHKPLLPYKFSYDEAMPTERGRTVRQRVHLALWDPASVFDYAAAQGYSYCKARKSTRRNRIGKFSPESMRYEVEYLKTEGLDSRVPHVPFWFLDLFDHQVFSSQSNIARRQRCDEFFRRWGYSSRPSWTCSAGLLRWPLDSYRELTFLQERCGKQFLPITGIYVASLFAHLIVRVQTINGARLGEVQQIAQNPDCIKQLVNIGPRAATRWLLRMIPKGSGERANFFIDEDTKDHLMKVVAFLQKTCGAKKIPRVAFYPTLKTPPDRYILQWNGQLLGQEELTVMFRFLLHGVVINPADGKGIHLTSHLLRHALATEMASLKVPVDVIATVLHQRDISVTQYYSRPTSTQVMESMEALFVDRIDLGAEALRSPNEIGRMLKEAEGKVGALTEVLGGTCTIGNLCPAKFACIGCVGNAPDPDKRRQIERKRAWAKDQREWARRQGLFSEERQMRQLVEDCDLVLEEMKLIQQARTDSAQLVQIQSLGVECK